MENIYTKAELKRMYDVLSPQRKKKVELLVKKNIISGNNITKEQEGGLIGTILGVLGSIFAPIIADKIVKPLISKMTKGKGLSPAGGALLLAGQKRGGAYKKKTVRKKASPKKGGALKLAGGKKIIMQ